MTDQHNDSKDNNETEKTVLTEETTVEIPAACGDSSETETLRDSGETQAEEQIPPRNDDSSPEAKEAAVEGNPDKASGDDISAETPDLAVEFPDLPEENAETAEPETQSADLAAQIAEVRDQLLRKAADFENFRKRMNQEKQRAIEYANESLLLDIIPIIDDFERAIQSAQTSDEIKGLPAGKALLDGIEMIEKRLVGQLENKWGLKRFNSAGELFDPNIHEAVLMEKSPDIEEALVQEDLVKGYMLKERVIRAAKVKVLMPEEVVSS